MTVRLRKQHKTNTQQYSIVAVDPGWAGVTTEGRSKVLIPWAEDDPGLAGPELWVERILNHARTGANYGCNGLLAIHWRTSELVPEFAAVQAAAWEDTPTAKEVYQRFCTAEFGEEVSDEMTEIFLGLDSFAAGVNLSATSYPGTATKLPRVSRETRPICRRYILFLSSQMKLLAVVYGTESCCGKFGPCFDMPSGPSHGHCKADACNGFLPNATCPPVGFEFLGAFKKAEAKVVGAANKARFTVWQKSFEYFAQLVDVELAGTQLNEALVDLNKPNATVAEKRANLTAALPLLEKLSRAWEKMTTSLQQTVMSAGTLGTLATNDANMYVRNFPFQPMTAAFETVGLQLPPSALPTMRYLGPERLFVRTVRTTVLREELTLSITATLLSQTENTVRGAPHVKQRAVRVHWRAMGGATEQWQTAAAEKIGRTTGMASFVDARCNHP